MGGKAYLRKRGEQAFEPLGQVDRRGGHGDQAHTDHHENKTARNERTRIYAAFADADEPPLEQDRSVLDEEEIQDGCYDHDGQQGRERSGGFAQRYAGERVERCDEKGHDAQSPEILRKQCDGNEHHACQKLRARVQLVKGARPGVVATEREDGAHRTSSLSAFEHAASSDSVGASISTRDSMVYSVQSGMGMPRSRSLLAMR